MRSALLVALVAAADAVGPLYTPIGAGPCRGTGGATDNPNRRSTDNVATEAACEAYCDSFTSASPLCTGFAYEATGAKECILYGPGMSGACAPPNQDLDVRPVCISTGTCDAGGPASASGSLNVRASTGAAFCGTCSDPNAVMDESCASAGGTWTAGTWTTTGVWEEAATPWEGQFEYTTHVHAFSANANYQCYDKDVTDHVGTCGAGNATCAAIFAAASTYDEDACPSHCTWTPTRSSPAPRPAHPTPTAVAGYTILSGACRGTSSVNAADPSLPQNEDRPNYVYTRNSAFPTISAPFTSANLAAACAAINTAKAADATKPDCLGFHSGPWTALFGNGMNDATWAANEMVAIWTALGGDAASSWGPEPGNPETSTISATKPNHQYFCFIKDAETPPAPSDDGDEAPCFPSTATVTKADGTTVRVDALKEGDAIVAATAEGALTTDTVSLLSIAKPETQATFVTLATAANTTLTITAGHHVPVGAACCATLKKAADVQMGETVWTVVGGAAVATTVAAKSAATAAGLHSPVLTNGGFPVVDGHVTSFDTIEMVALAKFGIAPMVAACKATGTCKAVRHLFFGDDAKFLA